jgi:hypothetical protein
MTLRKKIALAAFAALALFALPVASAQARPYYRPYYRGYYRPWYYGPRFGVGVYVAPPVVVRPAPVVVTPPLAPVIVTPPVVVRPGY